MNPRFTMKTTISLAGFLLGLSGAAYTLWILMVDRDLQAIPLFLQSVMIVFGAGYLLMGNNDHHPHCTVAVRDTILVLFMLSGLSSLAFLNETVSPHAGYFAGLAIAILVLVFCIYYKRIWENRVP